MGTSEIKISSWNVNSLGSYVKMHKVQMDWLGLPQHFQSKKVGGIHTIFKKG